MDDIIFNNSVGLKKQLENHQLQLQEKEQLLIEQKKENEEMLIEQKQQSEKEKEQTMLDLFPVNTPCIYFGTIDNKSMTNESLIKFGITNDLKQRISVHKKTFQNFNLVHVYRSSNNLHIENEIKKYQEDRRATMKNATKRKKNNRLRSLLINSKNYTELLALNEDYTIDYFHDMIVKILEKHEYNVINYKELQDKHKETEIMNKKLNEQMLLLNHENEKLKKELDQFTPIINMKEKQLQQNSYSHCVQGYFLYVFQCNNPHNQNRFKIDMCRLSEIEERERIHKMSDKEGIMKYHIKIRNPFFDKILRFLLKKELLSLGNNTYDGSFEEIKCTIDSTVLLEKLISDHDTVGVYNVLEKINKIDIHTTMTTNDPDTYVFHHVSFVLGNLYIL